jgi:outer membrane protein TolC
MTVGSPSLIRKGATMRSPHRDANAGDRRVGKRPWRLMLAILIALASGCVMRQAPRRIEGEDGLQKLGIPNAPSASATGDSVARPLGEPPGPAPVASTASASSPKGRPAPETDSPRRVAIASARAAPAAGNGTRCKTADPDVKLAADADQVPVPPVIPPPSGEHPIDLATALRLADTVNPTINRARSVVLEALALQLTARTLLVPSLNAGLNYHGHNGDLQRSSGKIISVSSQSLYIGSGAYTVAAETVKIPGVNILTPLTDAWFEPLAAHQRVIASEFNARATANDILMEVAVYYVELIRHNVLLEANRLSESQAYQIVQATNQYAIAGQGRQADADRARAEWRYRRADVIDAEQGVAVAAARLAQRLNLDPSVRLHPVSGPLVPLDLVALDTSPEQLIQVALQQRPDLAARSAEIGQAEYYVKQEIGRPFLPTLWLGFSGGVFGGGSNLVPPLLGNFAGRTDFDVRLYWTLLNMGAGNLSLIKQRKAEENQAVALRARTLNRVRDEVATNLAEARTARNQIDVARRELMSSRNGFHEDLERSRSNLGRPIEVINSLNLLAAARIHLIDAIVRYDQAQFRLWVALGTPPPLVETSAPDQPPVPEYLIP